MNRVRDLQKLLLYPLKPLSYQAAKSHAGKRRSYKPPKNSPVWNNAAYEVERKERKDTQHRIPPIATLISIKRKNRHIKIRRPTLEAKNKKRNKTGKKLKENKLIKLN